MPVSGPAYGSDEIVEELIAAGPRLLRVQALVGEIGRLPGAREVPAVLESERTEKQVGRPERARVGIEEGSLDGRLLARQRREPALGLGPRIRHDTGEQDRDTVPHVVRDATARAPRRSVQDSIAVPGRRPPDERPTARRALEELEQGSVHAKRR